MHSTPDHEPAADDIRLRRLLRRLERAYGRPRWQPALDPLGELIATILSQSTSDTNSDRAYEALRTAFPTWEEVMHAHPDHLAQAIHSGGLAILKGRRIQEILRAIKADRGRLNLDFLKDVPIPAARAYLAAFPGVGPKTVACVLLFACGHPAFPVDTHVFRITTRLGLLPSGCTAERAHTILEPLIPPAQVYSAHINLIRHGRTTCQARQPACQHCCLRTLCPVPQHSPTTPCRSKPATTSRQTRARVQSEVGRRPIPTHHV
jgi:endonuclease-3